jgi:hypothetical protein
MTYQLCGEGGGNLQKTFTFWEEHFQKTKGRVLFISSHTTI